MIVLAIEYNDNIIVFNEKKEEILRKKGKLYNYTENTVAIKIGNAIDVYNENGEKIFSYPYDIKGFQNIIGTPIV